MAQLVIAAIGAAIGAATLGTGIVALGLTGTAIGWTVGSLIGSAFAPGQKSQGPRLGDLSVGTSSYGTPIPYTQGSPRLAGQIVWASRKREIATTTRQGGKGGGGAKLTTYTYEVDLLILLTDNVIDGISRVWINGKLVWNKSETADATTITNSDATSAWTRITAYTGASTQLPDPTYEAAVTTANAPAYRGRGSVFIEGLQLGASGQIPNITFELSAYGTLTTGGTWDSDPGENVVSVAMSDTKAIVMRDYNSGGVGIYGGGHTFSGNVITSSASAPMWGPPSCAIGRIVKLDATRAFFTFADTGVHYGVVLTLSGNTVSAGTRYALPATFTSTGDITLIDTDKVLLQALVSATTAKCCVVTLAGNVVTYGATQTSPAGATTTVLRSMVATSASTMIDFWMLSSGTVGSYMRNSTISGDTVTWGAEVFIDSNKQSSKAPMGAVTSSSALVNILIFNSPGNDIYSYSLTASGGSSGLTLSQQGTGSGCTGIAGLGSIAAVLVTLSGTGVRIFRTNNSGVPIGAGLDLQASGAGASASKVSKISASKAFVSYILAGRVLSEIVTL